MSFPVHVTFMHPENGYPADQEKAAAHLEVGETYTIAQMQVGNSHSDIWLYEKPEAGSFNSVMFEAADFLGDPILAPNARG